MKRYVVVLSICLLFCFAVSELNAKSISPKPAVSAALEWLSLIDKSDYGASWKEASSYFQGAIAEEKWTTTLEGVRTPLGGILSRKATKVQETNSLPGAPDGKYVVMQFSTSFEHKKSAVETVTFMFEKDGKWRAAGYFIK